MKSITLPKISTVKNKYYNFGGLCTPDWVYTQHTYPKQSKLVLGLIISKLYGNPIYFVASDMSVAKVSSLKASSSTPNISSVT